MNDEITVEYGGESLTAEYSIDGDMLTVYFPNGGPSSAVLRGLKPETIAKTLLKGYVKQQSK